MLKGYSSRIAEAAEKTFTRRFEFASITHPSQASQTEPKMPTRKAVQKVNMRRKLQCFLTPKLLDTVQMSKIDSMVPKAQMK